MRQAQIDTQHRVEELVMGLKGIDPGETGVLLGESALGGGEQHDGSECQNVAIVLP